MGLAYKEAEKGYLLNEVPVGAILVDNTTNSIISSAYNQVIKQKIQQNMLKCFLLKKVVKKRTQNIFLIHLFL